jgi:hypothetical protein
MSRRGWSVLALFAAAVVGTAYFSFLAGTNRALAASSVVNSLSINAEEQCYQTNDPECFRASWFLRAGTTAMAARRSLDGSYSAAVEPELRSYVRWAERLPEVYAPAR